MGVTITNFPVYGGAADISGVYSYVRDMRTTKLSDNTHQLNFVGFFEVDVSGVTQRLQTTGYNDVSTNVFPDVWGCAYDKLKLELDNLGLSHVDS